jgi:hypothetical protein
VAYFRKRYLAAGVVRSAQSRAGTAGYDAGFQKSSERKRAPHAPFYQVALFLTFSTYGTHLPGDARGSYDHVRQSERRFLSSNPNLESCHRRRMKQDRFLLSMVESRTTVRNSIVTVCAFRGWFLYALHVRTDHVHAIVEAECAAGRVLNDWKAYATRSLRSAGLVASDRMIWAHGGHTVSIAQPERLRTAIRYVLEEQGPPMEIYCAGADR